MVIWQKDRNFANSRWRTDAILKIVFLAISRRHIGRSTQNLVRRWRITCRYRSRDQNCNFRKFKMAGGRHFENSITSISQPKIIRFRSNLVGRCTFRFPWWTFNKKSKFCKFKMADERYIENCFSAIYRRHIGPLMWNLEQGWRITCRYRSHDQNYNFSQIEDGGRPPFWKVFGVYVILVRN